MTKTVRIEQYYDGFSVMVMDDDVKIADINISQENIDAEYELVY